MSGDAERAVREEIDLHYWLDKWGHRFPLYVIEELRVIARNQVRAIEAVEKDANLLADRRAEQILLMQDEGAAAIEAVRAETTRHNFGPCELCWHIAWSPAPPKDEGKPHTFKDPHSPSQFMRCDYCWLKDEYLKVRRDENEACAKLMDVDDTTFGWEFDSDVAVAAIRARIGKENKREE